MTAPVKIQPVPVVLLFIPDVHAAYPDIFAVQKGGRPRRGIVQTDSFYINVAASQKAQQHRAVDASRIRKGFPVSVDLTRACNANVFRVLCVQKTSVQRFLIPVAVMVRVCSVVCDIPACHQYRRDVYFQQNIGFQIQTAGQKLPVS